VYLGMLVAVLLVLIKCWRFLLGLTIKSISKETA
jgi:hypothetical protein